MSDSQPVAVRLTRRPLLTESAVGTAPPAPAAGEGETVNITIDGKEVQVQAGQWIIQAADEAGVYIPRFCYHPRMKPVGMCRMCLVEVEGPRGATLMPACYNAVSEGMVIHTESEKAKKAQEGVLEFLLVNHPLDCPVCDKGGECPLQDQTLAYGPGESRFVEEKRHWEKPIPISDLVYLDRERCIQCGRCVRFADEVAGDPLIDFAERGDKTEVATFPGEPYSSYFSGNVVQICPVGALTAKPYRFKARPWDLEQVESTCSTCAVGCRAAVQSSSGEVTRLIGVDSDPVNWGWLCDKGRFVFPPAESDSRLAVPLVRRGGELVEASWNEALAAAAAGISQAMAAGGGTSVGVIGGSRLANEDAYVWAKVARTVFGTDNIDAQLGDGIDALTLLGLPRATIDQAASAPVVITIAPDIKDELPVLYLRLRHAVRENGTQLIELTPALTGLTPYSAESALYRPGGLAALVDAVVGSETIPDQVAGVPAETIESIRSHIARAKETAPGGGPQIVVILGRANLAESADQVGAAAHLLAAVPGVAFLSALRRGNVNGALDMGMAPGVLPGRVSLDEGRAWFEHHWNTELPESAGTDTAGILSDASRGHIGALVLLGADPLSDFPDSTLAVKGLLGARFVVAVETHLNQSSLHADVVLPAAAWAERRGTFTNIEGRISWLSQLVTDHGVAWPDWMIASELAARLGHELGYSNLEDIWAEVTRVSPLHTGAGYEQIGANQARDGLVVPVSGAGSTESLRPKPLDPMADPGIASAELHKVAPTALLVTSVSMVPETDGHIEATPSADDQDAPPPPPARLGLGAQPAPSETSDSTAGSILLVTRRTMWDAGTAVAASTALAALPPDATVRVHPAVLAEIGVAEGETVRVSSAAGSVEVAAKADPVMPRQTALLAWNLPGVRVSDLIDSESATTEVRIESLASEGDTANG